jgi:hypothetical protein
MEDAIKEANEAGINLNRIILIQDNIVRVQLNEEGGYSYSFFNDVEVNANLDTTNNEEYFFVINKK